MIYEQSKHFNFDIDQSMIRKLKQKNLKTNYEPGFPICKGIGFDKV